MIDVAAFQLLRPWWLLLLPPLWLLLWIRATHGEAKSPWRQLCDPHLLAQMTSAQSGNGGRVTASWILAGVLTVGVVAAAAPSWSRVSHPIQESTSARVVALDLSRSMQVQDVRPNRYLHARAAADEIIADDFSGETGLVVFSQSAFVLSPLSRDADSLLAFIDAVDPDTMPQDGNLPSRAINSAAELLAASADGRGHVILITSGDSLDQEAVAAAATAAVQGHRVSVLAIGSEAGGPLLDQYGAMRRDGEGRVRISRTNLQLLREIAEAGRGHLVVAAARGFDADLLDSRVDAGQLAEVERSAGQDEREAADDGVWLVWLMLPPALLLFRRNLLWMLLLALVIPVDQDALASGDGELWSHPEAIALEAFQRGDYEAARRLSENPMLLGACDYRIGRYEQALRQFSLVDSADARYNRANSLVQLQRYGEAVASYQQALELDPGLVNARYNLRLLELYLEQQETPGENADSADSDGSDEDDDSGETIEMRIGSANEAQANPADEQQFGPGSGASLRSDQVDPLERFDGEDLDQERFLLSVQDPGQAPLREFVERWISTLPETASELYRRKFQRDLQRQQLQQR